jgi:hypothetical protein
VLELLSLHLPPEFIPNALPFSTLARIHARAEKIAAADTLDKKLGAVDVVVDDGSEPIARIASVDHDEALTRWEDVKA